MERKPVSSSNIVSVGYAAEVQVLEVEFVGGVVWQYAFVPPGVHADLMKASSVGSFFAMQFKRVTGVYGSRRVDEAVLELKLEGSAPDGVDGADEGGWKPDHDGTLPVERAVAVLAPGDVDATLRAMFR